jgi:hypothetical protein
LIYAPNLATEPAVRVRILGEAGRIPGKWQEFGDEWGNFSDLVLKTKSFWAISSIQ